MRPRNVLTETNDMRRLMGLPLLKEGGGQTINDVKKKVLNESTIEYEDDQWLVIDKEEDKEEDKDEVNENAPAFSLGFARGGGLVIEDEEIDETTLAQDYDDKGVGKEPLDKEFDEPLNEIEKAQKMAEERALKEKELKEGGYINDMLVEGNTDPTQNHRQNDGSNPGIEDLLVTPTDRQIQDRLEQQLNKDVYSNVNNPTNIGKGTGKMYIFLNGKKLTIDGFVDQIQRDGEEGYCHTIDEYEYNNRALGATKITIKTDIGDCKTKTPKKPCEVEIVYPKGLPKQRIPRIQEWCKGQTKPDGTPCYPLNMKIDNIWGCETQKCWELCGREKTLSFEDGPQPWFPNGNMEEQEDIGDGPNGMGESPLGQVTEGTFSKYNITLHDKETKQNINEGWFDSGEKKKDELEGYEPLTGLAQLKDETRRIISFLTPNEGDEIEGKYMENIYPAMALKVAESLYKKIEKMM